MDIENISIVKLGVKMPTEEFGQIMSSIHRPTGFPYWVLHKIKFSFNKYSLLAIISYKNKAWVLHQGQKEMVKYIYIYVYLFFQYTINPLNLYIKCSYYYK